MKRLIGVVALTLALATVLLTAVGCGSTSEPAPETPTQTTQDPAALEGVEWQLVASSLSSADLAAAGITATFEGGRLSGFSGVNQYNGEYTAKEDGSFAGGPFAATLMAGPEPLMEAETAYLAALDACDGFSIDAGKLTLRTGADDTLVYEAAKAVELPGTKWNVVNYNNGKEAVVGLVEGSTLTLDFGTDGTVSGNSGVNTFSGPFTSTADTIKIGPLASTMMAGDQELMDQEAQYTAALEKSTIWTVVGGRLEMRDAGDAMQVLADSASQ